MSDNDFKGIDILDDENVIDYMKRRIDTLHEEKLEDMQTIHDLQIKNLELEHKLKAMQAALEIKDGIWDAIITPQKANHN